MGFNIGRGMDIRQGTSGQDVLSANREVQKSDDSSVEKLRQKLGTEFTGDIKRSTGKKKNELGKDDFMKLMSAQLKYQDPISPVKNEEMAAQLAQFSALEQMMNVNSTLEKMVSAQKPSEHMLAASLIGKRVTSDTTHFMLEKGGTPEISFNLPEDANAVNVAVVNAKGEVVREIELGEMQKGPQSVRWDGKNSKFQDQPLGEYSYRISATDKNAKAIALKSDSSGIVSGVTFEGGKSILLVDGKKVPMESVGRIASDTPVKSESLPKSSIEGGKPEADFSQTTGVDPRSQGAANSLAANKQNMSSQESSSSRGMSRSAKNSLPEELTPEKIKSMLAANSGAALSEASADEEAGETESKASDPLWNPATN